MPSNPNDTSPKPCAHCGHCPTCGHAPWHMTPVYPWYPLYPPYSYPWFGIVPPVVTSGYWHTGAAPEPVTWTLSVPNAVEGNCSTTWYKLDNGAGGTC